MMSLARALAWMVGISVDLTMTSVRNFFDTHCTPFDSPGNSAIRAVCQA
jgi:hypothetical protein